MWELVSSSIPGIKWTPVSAMTINFPRSSTADFQRLGFAGFCSVRELFEGGYKELPGKEGGVYLVFRPELASPQFLATGTGGFYKGKNPNVPVSELQSNWVDDANILYIGKAGGGPRSSLRTRVRALVRFGQGHPVGHWGGRYLWQLRSASELRICWKTTPGEDPRNVERDLIRAFSAEFGRRPFANLRD